MKKFLTGILVSTMVLGAMSVSMAVEIEENPYVDASLSQSETLSSGSCGENATYTYDESTKTLTISGSGEMNDIESSNDVPWYTHNEYIESVVISDGITRIGVFSFNNCTALTSVTIPDSVTSIGTEAFIACTSLTSVTIPDSVTTMGTGVFTWCSSLATVNLSSSLTSIGSSTFSACSSLSDITIPSSVTSIGEGAFENCTSLSNITISDSVTNIGTHAFNGCSSLGDITIPSSVTSLSGNIFTSCTSLSSITVDSNNENYSSENGCLFNKDKTTLVYYPLGMTETSYTIPSTVDTIGHGAFLNNTTVTSIILPSSITSIDDFAFSFFTSLSNITIPSTVTNIGDGAFNHCTSLSTITIPSSVTSIGKLAFNSCSGLTSITIPSSVTSIGESTFSFCANLNNITIPNSVTSIGDTAFHFSKNLSDVYYSGSSTEWSAITLGIWNDPLTSATIHYDGKLPDAPILPTFSSWATSHVEKAQQNHLIVDSLGADYTSNITRSQIADLLVNMVEKYTETTLTSADSSTFTDTSDTAILKANQAGIISGMGDGTFAPNSTATREQIAMMIYKTILVMEEATGTEIVTKNTELGQYNDSSDVSDWALEAVAVLANNGIMEGTGEGNLSPLATASIEQGIILNNALFELN